ncbi:BamA/TamA family outer membrane protein [Tamlana sp. 2_MG-2023]|uniref:translocation and assembly module lipoprotein TamL n=1 Tax=unclassified Tamlana TaxID=2614803 RepID=UPI0026E2B610|nr:MULTISPECIES: BamA/TamA family outer membrane protein [unclassified Tamlana]MDO6760583.1 BamA/TamA family outer membrane protein [Tamlana sp. 2_MG-2023]MDO6790839.1 BamA/TamA family outer membrane protein [Tamlana sp. 1_MG-2023]
MTFKNFIVLCILIVLCYACSVTKYIPEDELLYTGATLEIESDSLLKDKTKDIIKTNLNSVISVTPKPNGNILGMPIGLYFYYKNQQEHPGFINKWLYKNFGEEPVYQSDVQPFEVESLLLNRLDNRGFFYSSSSSEVIENADEKEASVDYKVIVAQPYKMENYTLDSLPQPIESNISAGLDKTIIKKDMRFDLPLMQNERKRIDQSLKKIGYYNFNERFLIFEADTNQYKNKRFDLFLKLKEETPKEAIIPYEISEINIYPYYNLETDTSNMAAERYKEKNYYQDELFFKLKYLDPFLTLEEGQHYNAENSKNTARRLSQIGTYKFVNIQYKEIDSALTDSLGKLEANIYLSPLNKRAIQAELQAVTKSNNFTGPAMSLSFINRNIFNGGETLKISAKIGYEAQFTSKDNEDLSSTQLGLSAELLFPRIIFPVKVGPHFFKYNIPKTKTSLSLDYLDRKGYFSLISSSALFGYTWDANRLVTYEINPISINYTKPWNITTDFQDILDDNPYMQDSFEQEFITGMTFSFTYNGLLETRKRDQIFFNTKLDIAGNSLSLFSKDNPDGSPNEIFGLEYAQYAKADVDIYYHHRFKKDHVLASRIFAGYGIAYGNSTILPNVKQYFAGGPYSVRAFRIRSLGPGTFDGSTVSDTYYDQTGNIRLEANVEYRFPIYSFLKGAAFVDAGNIWNSIENPALPGGKFSSDFLQELGMGAGVGLRVDVQGFVIRLDLATPFHNPALPEGERYEFDTQESVLNFAIGYPF